MEVSELKNVLAACALCALAASPASAVEVDGVAAQVGSATILKSEVDNELARFGARNGLSRTEVLNRMIDRKLILKAAEQSKMTMQEWLVDKRISEIVESSFDGDRNKLIASLGRDRIPYTEFRQRIKDDLVVGAMRWNTVEKNLRPSPAAMRREYEANPEKYRALGKVTVRVIYLKPEDAAKRDEVSAALAKEDFADVARRYSAGGNAENGGLYKDVVPEEEFNAEICTEIAKTPKGTVSHWVTVDGWSFLVMKIEESSSHVKSFKEAYDDIERTVRADEMKKLYDAWLDRLKADTYIKIY